jgi:hypothetical protein
VNFDDAKAEVVLGSVWLKKPVVKAADDSIVFPNVQGKDERYVRFEKKFQKQPEQNPKNPVIPSIEKNTDLYGVIKDDKNTIHCNGNICKVADAEFVFMEMVCRRNRMHRYRRRRCDQTEEIGGTTSGDKSVRARTEFHFKACGQTDDQGDIGV